MLKIIQNSHIFQINYKLVKSFPVQIPKGLRSSMIEKVLKLGTVGPVVVVF